jgi:hypothetical protein
MKKFGKLLGIIAVTALIVGLTAACEEDNTDEPVIVTEQERLTALNSWGQGIEFSRPHPLSHLGAPDIVEGWNADIVEMVDARAAAVVALGTGDMTEAEAEAAYLTAAKAVLNVMMLENNFEKYKDPSGLLRRAADEMGLSPNTEYH